MMVKTGKTQLLNNKKLDKKNEKYPYRVEISLRTDQTRKKEKSKQVSVR
jgi:hypothetical protein